MKVGQQTVKEFTYDAAGRTTAVETSAGTTTLAYDYESRVTGITYPGQATNSFTYNGLDTRVGMSDSGGSRTFLRDGVSMISPVLSDGNADYTTAISERRPSTTTFYHGGIKNGDSQSNTSESVTGSIQYDAFGNVTSSSGTWQGPFAYGGPYGYQSDPDSGLKLLGHRYYDPSTGRFLTRDPVKDGRNWYGYCDNNPVAGADPTGEAALALAPLVMTPPGAVITVVVGGLILVGCAIYYLVDSASRSSTSTDTSPSNRALPEQKRQPLEEGDTRTGPTIQPGDRGDGGRLDVYRLGSPTGIWWSTTDPRTDPDYYEHFGMRTNPRDNPGDTISSGWVPIGEAGRTWFIGPAKDYDGNPLNNGYSEIIIPNPGITVRDPVICPWDPGFFR